MAKISWSFSLSKEVLNKSPGFHNDYCLFCFAFIVLFWYPSKPKLPLGQIDSAIHESSITEWKAYTGDGLMIFSTIT